MRRFKRSKEKVLRNSGCEFTRVGPKTIARLAIAIRFTSLYVVTCISKIKTRLRVCERERPSLGGREGRRE